MAAKKAMGRRTDTDRPTPGPSRGSGRAPTSANTVSAIDSLIRRGVAGMSTEAKNYKSRKEFVSAMTDAISEGDLGRYPSSQWRKRAESAIGQAWSQGRRRSGK